MQKNKTDVVKAVCNSAAKKLVVLGLAVAVSGGAVVSAQKPKKDINEQLPKMSSLERLIETNGDEEKRQRLNALNSNIENIEARCNMLKRQAEEKTRQAEEKERQAKEKERQAKEKERQAKEKERQAEEKERQAEEKKREANENERQAEGMPDHSGREISIRCLVVANFLLDEIINLKNEIINLKVEIKNLKNEIINLKVEIENLRVEIGNLQGEIMNLQDELITLLRQRNALRDELEREIPEAQRDQAELMDLAVAMAETRGRPVEEVAPEFFASIGLPRQAIQNIMGLFGRGQQQNQEVALNMTLPLRSQQPLLPQQNQRPQYFGGSLNPLNWGLFGGSKK